MNNYKLTYLVSKTSGSGVSQINQIRKIVEEKGGAILVKEGEKENFQKINLAYPIKKNNNANIVAVEFSVDPIKIKEIIEKIRLNKDILRHILIKQATASTRKKIRRERKDLKIEVSGSQTQNLDEKKEKQVFKTTPIKKSLISTSTDKDKEEDVDDKKILKKEKTKKEKIKLEDIGEKLDEML